MTWTVEKNAPLVSTIRINGERRQSWEQYVLLTADRHFDNPMSDRKMQRLHMQQAIERDAPIIDFGDCFCAMQGRNDKRGSKSKVRKENRQDDYFGSLIRSGVKFFSPYKSQMAVWNKGNHESSILKHNEVDLTRFLIEELNRSGSPCVIGGYRGWIKFNITDKSHRKSFSLYYTHGSGGSAPVTKGVIGTNRRASYVDADIICSGHIHEAWSLELRKIGLSHCGEEVIRDQLHLCIPTYKEEFAQQEDGWHHEKGSAPKPLGAWWLRFYWDVSEKTIKYDYIRAK